MGIKTWLGAAAAVMVGLVGLGVWYWPVRESPELSAVKQLQAEMQQKMFAPPASQSSATQNERRAEFEKLREKMDALPEAERDKARNAMREGFQKQMQVKLGEFFVLSLEEQVVALDKEIDEQEARMKAWGGMPFGPPGGPRNSADQNSGNSNPGTPPAPNGSPGNRPFGSRGYPQNPTAEQRKDRQRQMLNSTTPEFRAQMAEYIKKMQQRRKERGLPGFGPRI